MSETVFYNVWHTPSALAQAALIESMRVEAPYLAAQPGFISLTAMIEEGGSNRVLVKGRWQSRAAFEAAVANSPRALESRKKLAEHGTSEPGLFHEAFRFLPPAASSQQASRYPNDDRFWSIFRDDLIDANGVHLHTLQGGQGEPLVLLHGFLDTWSVWRAIMPALAERFQLIVPDLRGFGDSQRTAHGYDKKTLATDISSLLTALGVRSAHVVGHDFGGQGAYRLAAGWPDLVRTLSVVESTLPGIKFESRGDDARFWFVPFHMTPVVPEMLVAGKEREYTAHLLRLFLHPRNVMTSADHEELERAYSQPGALRTGFELYRTFPQDLADFSEMYKTKLRMPVFAVGGEDCLENRVFEVFRQVGDKVTGAVIEQANHFVPMEQPEILTERLLAFLEKAKTSA